MNENDKKRLLEYADVLEDLGVLMPVFSFEEEQEAKHLIVMILQDLGYFIIKGNEVCLTPKSMILLINNEEAEEVFKYLGVEIERG